MRIGHKKCISLLLAIMMVFYVTPSIVLTSASLPTSEFVAEFNIVSEWGNNYEGKITLKNNGVATIENWKISFESENTIDSLWEAKIVERNSFTYVIEGNSWNAHIAPGGSVSFGFNARTVSGQKGITNIQLINGNLSPINPTPTATPSPTVAPVATPTAMPTSHPTVAPTTIPTIAPTATPTPTNTTDTRIKLEFVITSQWDGMFYATVKVKNISDKVIEDWEIAFDFPHEIKEIWNADITNVNENGNRYRIKNGGFNVNIPVGGEVSFGIGGIYANTITSPSNYTLLTGTNVGAGIVHESDYVIEYKLLDDWGSAFSAEITISNIGNTDINAWGLLFDYNRTIGSIWEAVVVKHENNHYELKNAGYNATIKIGQSITIGFNGSGGSSGDIPYNFVLTKSTETVSPPTGSTIVSASFTASYDALNRLIKVTYDNGYVIEYGYDSNGNITHVSKSVTSTATE